jgi:hypothetical protein
MIHRSVHQAAKIYGGEGETGAREAEVIRGHCGPGQPRGQARDLALAGLIEAGLLACRPLVNSTAMATLLMVGYTYLGLTLLSAA